MNCFWIIHLFTVYEALRKLHHVLNGFCGRWNAFCATYGAF